MANKVNSKSKYYLGDFPNKDERLGLDFRADRPKRNGEPYLMAVYAGEKRPPKKGEWYLSGAVITAYKAPNDLSEPYHIAKLIKVKTEVKTITIEL